MHVISTLSHMCQNVVESIAAGQGVRMEWSQLQRGFVLVGTRKRAETAEGLGTKGQQH